MTQGPKDPLDEHGAQDTVVLLHRSKPKLQDKVQQVGPIWVEVVGGPMDGLRRHVLGDRLTVGRSEENTVVLALDLMASGRHARIVRDGDDVFLEDLESKNGTYVGETRIAKRLAIQPGTIFSVGTTSVEFMPR